MASYYGKDYNSYSLDHPIRVGDEVQIEESQLGSPRVLNTGHVVRLDNRKATEGYTVLVEVGPGDSMWFRPDELRQIVNAAEARARVWTAPYALTARNEEEARRYITERALADVPDATVEIIRGPVRDRGPRSYWRATVRRTRTPEEA